MRQRFGLLQYRLQIEPVAVLTKEWQFRSPPMLVFPGCDNISGSFFRTSADEEKKHHSRSSQAACLITGCAKMGEPLSFSQ